VQTHQEVANRPASGALTMPEDRAAKEADVERKLRLYTAIQAFQQR